MDDQFAVIDLQYVFGIDALVIMKLPSFFLYDSSNTFVKQKESSRPINIEVNTPSEISQMFDAISYEKGGAILRMCANFLGEEVFRAGITRYLNTKYISKYLSRIRMGWLIMSYWQRIWKHGAGRSVGVSAGHSQSGRRCAP